MTKSSSSIKGMISPFECSSSSFSSLMKASRGVLSFSGGVGNNLKFSSRLLNHENELPISFRRSFQVVRQLSSPVCQLISGLCLFNQGKPRIILCFPNPVINNLIFSCRLFTMMSNCMKYLIVPCLLEVPSTLMLGDAPHCTMSPPIFLCHLCIFLLIVASPRQSALAAPMLESDDQ